MELPADGFATLGGARLRIVQTTDGDLIVGGQKIGEPNYAMASNGVIHEIDGIITDPSATSIAEPTIAATLRDDSDFITLANAFSTLKNPVGGESLADELAAAGPFTAGGGAFMLTRPAHCCRVCLSWVRAIMSNDTSVTTQLQCHRCAYVERCCCCTLLPPLLCGVCARRRRLQRLPRQERLNHRGVPHPRLTLVGHPCQPRRPRVRAHAQTPDRVLAIHALGFTSLISYFQFPVILFACEQHRYHYHSRTSHHSTTHSKFTAAQLHSMDLPTDGFATLGGARLTIVKTTDGDLIVGGQKIGEPNYAMASNGVIHEIGGVITDPSATSIATPTIAATLRGDSDFITLANVFSTLKNPVGGELLADELAAAGPFTAGAFILPRPHGCCVCYRGCVILCPMTYRLQPRQS